MKEKKKEDEVKEKVEERFFANYFQSPQVGFSLSPTCIVQLELLFKKRFFCDNYPVLQLGR